MTATVRRVDARRAELGEAEIGRSREGRRADARRAELGEAEIGRSREGHIATVQGAAAPARSRPAPRVEPGARPRPARPELRVVNPPAHRLGAIGVIGALLVFGLLFGLVVFQTLLVQNQQRLDRLQEEIRTAQGQYQAQRLKVAELESPGRIVAAATERLGMVPPPGTTYLTPSPAAAAEVGATTPAPAAAAGGADWPAIKAYLSERG